MIIFNHENCEKGKDFSIKWSHDFTVLFFNKPYRRPIKAEKKVWIEYISHINGVVYGPNKIVVKSRPKKKVPSDQSFGQLN